MKYLFCALFLTSFYISSAKAATYQLDSDHTRVIYFVSHMGFSNVLGHFNKVTGTVIFNPHQPEASKIDATIDATSVSMDNKALDEKLQEKDFFDTARFPVIIFKSTQIVKSGIDTGKMTGNVTLLGVTKAITMDIKFNKKGFDKYAQVAAVGFTATGELLRSDFGMKSYIPVVGDKITLRIEVEAHANSASVEN
jgi:polyisoprenoid-binding protein YceI